MIKRKGNDIKEINIKDIDQGKGGLVKLWIKMTCVRKKL
jgi:hypothetical protein